MSNQQIQLVSVPIRRDGSREPGGWEGEAAGLAQYARIPIAFEVRSRAVLHRTGKGELLLSEQAEPAPWRKDYDQYDGGSPADWPARFDVSGWQCFIAKSGKEIAGAAAVFMRSLEIHLLEGRDDLALLWDIRVVPEQRGSGIGSMLLAAAERWARDNGANTLKVETQDINVPACRFYQRHGFKLVEANMGTYPELLDEVQLIWKKDLAR